MVERLKLLHICINPFQSDHPTNVNGFRWSQQCSDKRGFTVIIFCLQLFRVLLYIEQFTRGNLKRRKKRKKSKRIDQGHWYCNKSSYVELHEKYKNTYDVFLNWFHMQFIENTSYSAMLNIAESVSSPEPVPSNSGNSIVIPYKRPTRHWPSSVNSPSSQNLIQTEFRNRTEFSAIPSDSLSIQFPQFLPGITY